MTISFSKYLKYRDKSYFRKGEKYLYLTHYGVRLSDIEVEGERVWAKGGLTEMMHSVECVNVKELVGLQVTLKNNTSCIGRINLRNLSDSKNLRRSGELSGYIGVFWEKIPNKSITYFWNDPNKLILLD